MTCRSRHIATVEDGIEAHEQLHEHDYCKEPQRELATVISVVDLAGKELVHHGVLSYLLRGHYECCHEASAWVFGGEIVTPLARSQKTNGTSPRPSAIITNLETISP